jgi:hypothetical protein
MRSVRILLTLVLGLAGSGLAQARGIVIGEQLIPSTLLVPAGEMDGDFITPWPDNVRIFPFGGYTAYAPAVPAADGTLSPYHQIVYRLPPAGTAAIVRSRLDHLGIPLFPTETEFLGKNPREKEPPIGKKKPEGKEEKGKPEPKKDPDKDKDKDKDLETKD